MKFEHLDRYMRRFELERQYCFPPEMYVVIQLQGQKFQHLSEKKNFQEPYDESLRDLMIQTTCHLLETKLSVVYGFTFDNEISLLIHKSMDNFGRLARKFSSILVGEASGKFSLLIGEVTSFEARIFQLPNEECMVDYFFWRREEASRTALHKYCHHLLAQENLSSKELAGRRASLDIKAKEKLLKKNGICFSSLPLWQKNGLGILWETYQQEGENPETGKKVKFWRKRIKIEQRLSTEQNEYREFLLKRV